MNVSDIGVGAWYRWEIGDWMHQARYFFATLRGAPDTPTDGADATAEITGIAVPSGTVEVGSAR